MRLIDADVLLKEIDGIHQRHYANSAYQFIHDFFRAMLRRIRKAPTIDAVEVVHGRWRKIYTCSGERLWGYECDQCKADNARCSYYCPNCGAKMDGERRSNEKK